MGNHRGLHYVGRLVVGARAISRSTVIRSFSATSSSSPPRPITPARILPATSTSPMPPSSFACRLESAGQRGERDCRASRQPLRRRRQHQPLPPFKSDYAQRRHPGHARREHELCRTGYGQPRHDQFGGLGQQRQRHAFDQRQPPKGSGSVSTINNQPVLLSGSNSAFYRHLDLGHECRPRPRLPSPVLPLAAAGATWITSGVGGYNLAIPGGGAVNFVGSQRYSPEPFSTAWPPLRPRSISCASART